MLVSLCYTKVINNYIYIFFHHL